MVFFVSLNTLLGLSTLPFASIVPNYRDNLLQKWRVLLNIFFKVEVAYILLKH